MVRRVSSERMVGRPEAVEAVSRSLAALGHGSPIHFVISGEAGVGKSRLLEFAREQAQTEGITVLSGACFDLGAQSLPLAPFGDILRGLLALQGQATLKALGGREVAALSRIAPSLASEVADDAVSAATLVPEQLFESLLALLRRVAQRSPLLVELEDLHVADDGTLDAARYLMRSLHDDRVALFVTFRSESILGRDRLRSWLGDVARSTRVERLELTPLSGAEMQELVEAITGAPVARELLETIMARSDGNPFFAEELLASSVDGPISASLNDVLRARADNVSTDARRLLDVAAISGREVAHELLVAIAGLDEADATGALGELIDGGLLVPLSDENGEAYRFRHALLAEVTRAQLLPIVRRRLHAAYAAELDERGAGGSADAVVSVTYAFHLREAGDPRALEASLAAGDAAAGVLAWDVARTELEQALRLLDASSARGETVWLGPNRDRADLLERIAAAAFMGSEYSTAKSLLEEALGEVDHSDRARTVRLWVQLGESCWRAGEREQAIATMRTAVGLAGDGVDEVRVRALAGLAQIEMLIGDMSAADEHVKPAARMARELGLRELEGHAMCTQAVVEAARGRGAVGVELGRAALAIAQELEQPYDLGRAYINLSDALWMNGDAAAALAVAQEALASAIGRPFGASYRESIGYGAVLFAYDTGDWQLARRLLDEADEIAGEARRSGESEAYRAEYVLRFLVGSGSADAESTWRRGLGEWSGEVTVDTPTLLFAGGVELLTRAGRYADAVAAAEHRLQATERLQSWVVSHELLCQVAWPLAELALAARARGDQAAEAESLRRLDGLVVTGTVDIETMGRPAGQLGTWLGILRRQTMAEAARAGGSSDPQAWAGIASSWSALGRPYRVGYALWRKGQAHLERGDWDDARAALEAALEVATRLGARPMLEDLQRTARGAGIAWHAVDTARAAERPFGLSPREHEVLRLVAAGQTNRQIAERLFISPSTAGVHVSNILGKLGVGSRVEATRIAVSEGLVDAVPER